MGGLRVTGDELVRLLSREAGVAVSSGEPFGTADHIRLNVWRVVWSSERRPASGE